MATPQLLHDIARLRIQVTPALALVSLLLAGNALRLEGGSTFAIGGGFTKWMFWAIVPVALPQLPLWFKFIGVAAPDVTGDVGANWITWVRDYATALESGQRPSAEHRSAAGAIGL